MTLEDYDLETYCVVWGLGLIGYTLAGELARSSRRVCVVDIDPARVERLNAGESPFTHLGTVSERYVEEVRTGAVWATLDADQVVRDRQRMHFVCVPTEGHGRVDSSALANVVERLSAVEPSAAQPLHLVVESTIAPSWVESVVHAGFSKRGWQLGRDYHVTCSPRRDWLLDGGRAFCDIPKVIGSDTEEGYAEATSVYGDICRTLVRASDARHAAATKVVENLFRYNDILLANQLALNLEGFDVAELLIAASTKWNVEAYFPSLGIGGYCVPLAKDYLAQESERAAAWTANLSAEAERLFAEIVARTIGALPVKSAAVLGIAYAPEMKIHTNSPALSLIRDLQSRGVDVAVHDPLYSAEEVESLTGCRYGDFPDVLKGAELVVLHTGHVLYLNADWKEIGSSLVENDYVVDNTGGWLKWETLMQGMYLRPGESSPGERRL